VQTKNGFEKRRATEVLPYSLHEGEWHSESGGRWSWYLSMEAFDTMKLDLESNEPELLAGAVMAIRGRCDYPEAPPAPGAPETAR
jgi:hypothetical protein